MKILVIGDSCNDIHVYGKCERLCPEAPVPVFHPIQYVYNPGMAGNVKRNLESLGAVVGIITNQKEIEKTRYVDEHTNQMFLRVDTDVDGVPGCTLLDSINWEEYDAVVISDYNKGFLSEGDIRQICGSHKLVFMDTKKIIGSWAYGATLIKLNTKEYEQSRQMISILNIHDKIITTKGQYGCEFRKKMYPVRKVDVKDLSGAGDTFMAGLVVSYLNSGGDIEKAINFANLCSTEVVQKRGVSSI